MNAPVLWALPVLTGRAHELEAALDALPVDAWKWLAGNGGHAVFMGAGELCVLLEDPDPTRFTQDAWRSDDARALRDALDPHTAFDADKPDSWLTRDVHHAGEPVTTPHVVPNEN